MTIPEKLTYAINKRGVSIRALSEMTGIAKSAIQRYASGDVESVPIYRLEKLALALNVSPAWLIGWADDEQDFPFADMTRDTPETAPALEHEMEPDEAELLAIYRGLNDIGQAALMGTARGLAANPDMKRGSASNTETA